MKDKPAAAIGKPSSARPDDIESEALQDMREEAVAQAAIDAKKAAHANKVADMLSATYFVTDYTWPFLRSADRQMAVTEFYPELNVAVDKFYYFGAHEEGLVKDKKRLLNENGIKYVFLNASKSLGDIGPEIDEQSNVGVKK